MPSEGKIDQNLELVLQRQADISVFNESGEMPEDPVGDRDCRLDPRGNLLPTTRRTIAGSPDESTKAQAAIHTT